MVSKFEFAQLTTGYILLYILAWLMKNIETPQNFQHF